MNAGDTTGRKQMASNVLASWGSQMVFIVAGFIMPHMIDRRLGQNMLGVWDFAWSVVSYFSLVQVGIVSSISRYVAMYRATGDSAGINRAASSVMCLLLSMALAILGLTAIAVYALESLHAAALGPYIADARWVVFLLGIEIAFQTIFSVFGGVVAGFHRWGIHNGVTAGSYFLTAAAMIAALLLGSGLRTLALIHLLGEVGAGLARWIFSYRICPTLRLDYAHARRETIIAMAKYGAKSWAPSIGDLILNQSLSILVAVSLGPAFLAIYSRSRSLVRYARDLVTKMAAVLVASVSSLDAAGELRKIQDLVIKGTRYSAFLSFPLAMLLIICGGVLVRIWMGTGYEASGVAATLALGQTAAVLQLPALAILAGMNRHGRLAAANLLGSIVSVCAVVWVTRYLHVGLLTIALAATIPLLIINLIYAPIHACRSIGLPLNEYFTRSILLPLFWTLPFGCCLIAARSWFGTESKIGVVVGVAVGGAVLAPIYWRNVIPQSLKATVMEHIPSRVRGLPPGKKKEQAGVATALSAD